MNSRFIPFALGLAFMLSGTMSAQDERREKLLAELEASKNEAEKSLEEAERRFFAAQDTILSDYRKELAAILEKCDRIEVYLLDFEIEIEKDLLSNFVGWENHLEAGEFPVLPYGQKCKILQSSVLTAEQRANFLPKLQKVVGVQGQVGGGAFCHYPIHGVRIFSGEKIIFQNSFCWKCQNFAVAYPSGAGWVKIEGTALHDVFSQLMPIPQSEIDRFNATYGEKTTDPKTGTGDKTGQDAASN